MMLMMMMTDKTFGYQLPIITVMIMVMILMLVMMKSVPGFMIMKV